MVRKTVVLSLLALALVMAACDRKTREADSFRETKAVAPDQTSEARPEGGGAPDAAVVAPEARDAAAPPISLPQVGAKVIQNAEIEVRVGKGDFQDQFSKASLIAQQLGGFVAGSSISETEGKIASGTITLRIPSEKFESGLSDLRSLGKVTRESRSGQDVTQEFVDLEARLRHAKSEEAFYLRLMDEAKSVSELISVRQQLSEVQLRIEELTGRIEFLKNQTSYATVTARIFEAGLEPSKPKTGLAKAWQEAIDGFRSVVGGAIVVMGWIAPFAVAGLVGAGAYRAIRRRAAKPATP